MTPTRFPDVVRIEPYGGNCNFACRHCPTGLNGGKRGLLTFNNFVILFQRLPLIPRVLVLYHGSEPLVNPHLQEMLTFAKEAGVGKTVLNTNAALLRPLTGLDEMRVSFDGVSPEQNNYIRKNGDFYKQAEKVKAAVERGQKVVIYNTQPSSGKHPAPAEYLKETFGNSVKYRTEPMRLWSSQEVGVLGSEIISKPTGSTYCSDLFTTFTILSDGTVPKCCEDLPGQYLYGNAFDERPMDIWNRMQVIRDDFRAGNYPDACSQCWVVAGRFMKEGLQHD